MTTATLVNIASAATPATPEAIPAAEIVRWLVQKPTDDDGARMQRLRAWVRATPVLPPG